MRHCPICAIRTRCFARWGCEVWWECRPESRPGRFGVSAFDEADVARAWTLTGILRREFHSLSLAQQFEYGAADRTAVEEVLEPALVSNEAEALVDKESCDGPVRHNRSPPFEPRENPQDFSAGIGLLRSDDCVLRRPDGRPC